MIQYVARKLYSPYGLTSGSPFAFFFHCSSLKNKGWPSSSWRLNVGTLCFRSKWGSTSTDAKHLRSRRVRGALWSPTAFKSKINYTSKHDRITSRLFYSRSKQSWVDVGLTGLGPRSWFTSNHVETSSAQQVAIDGQAMWAGWTVQWDFLLNISRQSPRFGGHYMSNRGTNLSWKYYTSFKAYQETRFRVKQKVQSKVFYSLVEKVNVWRNFRRVYATRLRVGRKFLANLDGRDFTNPVSACYSGGPGNVVTNIL